MKTLYKYLLMCIPFITFFLCITACDDDEAVDPYDINYVYIYSPSDTDNRMEYKGNGTFLVGIEPESVLTPVRCTKPAPEDMTIHFGIDASLVDSYNQDHGTNYTLLKSAQLENAALSIKRGEYISADSLKVHYTDMTEFQNGMEKYILPISITSVTGSGVSISKESQIYLTFTSSYKANFVNIGSSKSFNLEYENEGFTNLAERMELPNLLTSSWNADGDIDVTLKIDESLVNKYNAVNGTNYVLMPHAAFEYSTVTIKEGTKSLENEVALVFSDAMASVELGKGYILPITITKVNGVGAEIGESFTTYVVFNTVEKLTLSVEEAPVGTAIEDFTGWSITMDGKSQSGYGVSWMNLVLDPGDWIDVVTASNTLEVNMGKLQTVSSIKIGYYYGQYYSALAATIAFSTDGMNYKVGQCTLTAANAHNFVLQYPTEVQYMRITFPKGVSSWGTYPVSLSVYTTE